MHFTYHILFVGKVLSHDSQDIWRDFGDLIRILAEQPENGGSGHGDGDVVNEFGHVSDDGFVLRRLSLEQLLDYDDGFGNDSFVLLREQRDETVEASVGNTCKGAPETFW